MGFEIGKTVAGYEIVEVLGTSKTGVAYKVRNVFAQRFEVLKILPKSIQDDEEQNARFLREIKVHAQLLHPNIVTFYNAREIEGQLVMTTELVPGVTLSEKLQAGPIAWRDASKYACDALLALEYAHGHGIIHRGFNSSNLMITGEGVARLTGFGFAKSVSDPELTAAGVVIGALKYMSPEQVKGETIDIRCDTYSLGIVLYEMLVGRVPFDAKGQFEIMMAQVNTAPKHVSDVNPAVPRALGDLVDKALAKSPDGRFQTARDFRQAIEQISLVTESKAPSTVAGVPQPAADPVPPIEIAKPISQPSPADTWALESALELAESKLPTMELKSIQPVVETSAFPEPPALAPAALWETNIEHEPASKSAAIDTAPANEPPSAVPQLPVDWWVSDAVATAESKPVATAQEVAHSMVDVAPVEAPVVPVSATFPDAHAMESALIPAESQSQIELPPAVAAFDLTEHTLDTAIEATPLHEAPSATLQDAHAIESAIGSAEATLSSSKSEFNLTPTQTVELPPDLTPPLEGQPRVASTSLPDVGTVEPTSIESAPPHIESISEPDSKLLEEPPAAFALQTPALDWWALNAQLTANEPDSSHAEFSLTPPEPEPIAPVAETLVNAEPAVTDNPIAAPDFWSTDWPTPPVESKAESAQLDLLSTPVEPETPLAGTPVVAESPEPPAPVLQPPFWVTEAAPNEFESTPETADLLYSPFAPEPKGSFGTHEEPPEEPLSLWTSGPPDTWVSEPAATPQAVQTEPADRQSLSAAIEPPQPLIEPAPHVEEPVAAPVLAQEASAATSEPPAIAPAPQVVPEVPQTAAAAASTPAPVAQIPTQVNPDLLTALFGDTLLSRVSLTLVVCAITFFLGTVTLFAVLSVTKP